MKRLSILGSTGSIGRSTLSVVEAYPDRFAVATLAAGGNLDLTYEQTLRWKPSAVSLASEQDADKLRTKLKASDRIDAAQVEVVHGPAGSVRAATHPDVDFVVSAIVGVAGLEATYEAVKAGKTVGLANKECLVVAGELITAEARRQGKPLLPIDSEHNAVHQCLRGGRGPLNEENKEPNVAGANSANSGQNSEVERIWLTASGGPFLHKPKSEFASITVQQALNHPTWKMGKRITIDSATLMNKGFEVIEACRLFDLPPERIQVLVHPQSTIHSLVEFVDGSILAQISVTDMRLPILYALTYPERIPSDLRFNLMDLRHLDFWPPDMAKFPCLRLAYEAAQAGGAKTVALNAADEVAVAAFLEERIGFEDIPRLIEETLAATPAAQLESIQDVLKLDTESRLVATEFANKFASGMVHRQGVRQH